ncbi:MAG: preprotein translocase subunit SecA, partial [Deltaproteobacteria bacterium]
SRFYLALEDDLLRIFGGERMTGIMEKLGMQAGEPIEHNLLSKAIENAQRKVEGQNFEIRKQVLEYDDVMNQQREVIYKRRREILTGKSLEEDITDIIAERIELLADGIVEDKVPPEEWDYDALDKAVFKQFNYHFRVPDDEPLENLDRDSLIELLDEATMAAYRKKEAEIGETDFRNLERYVLLQNIDTMWKDHLLSMDHLKEGIGLRGYAQQDPLLIYKKEGYEMFSEMMDRVAEETLGILFRIELAAPQEIEQIQQKKEQDLVFSGGGDAEPPKRKPVKRKEKKVGRNAPCPCGSGKKFKKCCGR